MSLLRPCDVLDLWDHGEGLVPAQRALVALALAGCPVPDPTVGQRDAVLLDMYATTFGPTLSAVATCPECGQVLDVDVPAAALILDPPETREGSLDLADGPVTYRLPEAADVAVAADADDLFARCVTGPVAADTRAEIERLMAVGDPGAELEVVMTCLDCGHEWTDVIDPITFLWTAAEASARQLAEEVGALGRAYGWSEAEVLAMSGRRRRLYLEAVPG